MGSVNILSSDVVKRNSGVAVNQNIKVKWKTSELTIKQFISLEEYINVIHNILNDCQTADGVFTPEIIDFSIRIHIISAYAFIELPNNINEIYHIAYVSDLYETVCSVANKQQINSIIKSVMLYMNVGGEYD